TRGTARSVFIHGRERFNWRLAESQAGIRNGTTPGLTRILRSERSTMLQFGTGDTQNPYSYLYELEPWIILNSIASMFAYIPTAREWDKSVLNSNKKSCKLL